MGGRKTLLPTSILPSLPCLSLRPSLAHSPLLPCSLPPSLLSFARPLDRLLAPTEIYARARSRSPAPCSSAWHTGRTSPHRSRVTSRASPGLTRRGCLSAGSLPFPCASLNPPAHRLRQPEGARSLPPVRNARSRAPAAAPRSDVVAAAGDPRPGQRVCARARAQPPARAHQSPRGCTGGPRERR